MPSDETISDAILALVAQRAPRTACPSEVARGLADDWRPLMAEVRRVAAVLAAEGHLAILRGGHPADPLGKGPIRIAAPRTPA